MNIKLHNITCDASVLDKTAYLNAVPTDMTAYFNSLIPQDLLNPVLIVDSTINPSNFNYVYITDLNAYYFLARPIVLSNNRYELRLEKDVLFSNLSIIKNSYAIIKRSYTNGDVTLVDATDVFSEEEKIDFIDMSTYNVSEFHLSDTDNYLLVYYDTLANANTSPHQLFTHTTNNYDDGIQPNINADAFTLGYQQTGTIYRVLNTSQLFMLAIAIRNNESLLTFIKGVYKIPMQTSETNELKFRVIDTGQHEICLGTTIVDLRLSEEDTSVLYAPYSYRSRWVYQDFTLFTTSVYKNYWNQNPYTRYELWCPFTGWVEIPASNIINKRLKVFYTLNLENGESTCNIYDVASETIIATKSANFVMQIPLSTANMRDLEERKTSLALNTIIGTLASVVAIAGGVATYNPVAVAGGAISLGKTASNAITGFNQLHPSGNMALLTTNASWQSKIAFKLRKTYKSAKRIIENRIGRPCNRYAQISGELGYFEAYGLILSSNAGLCKDEIEKIKILIEKGCFAS